MKSKKLAACLLLVGCASNPIPYDKTLYTAPLSLACLVKDEDSAEIRIYRKEGYNIWPPAFHMDGNLVANLNGGESTVICVRPGYHSFSWGNGLMTSSVKLAPGECIVISLSTSDDPPFMRVKECGDA